MLLSNIINLVNTKKKIILNKNLKIEYISANSKLIKKNSIYVTNFKKDIKKKFIDEAIKNGAIAILTNKRIRNIHVPQFIVDNLSLAVNSILWYLKPFPPLHHEFLSILLKTHT